MKLDPVELRKNLQRGERATLVGVSIPEKALHREGTLFLLSLILFDLILFAWFRDDPARFILLALFVINAASYFLYAWLKKNDGLDGESLEFYVVTDLRILRICNGMVVDILPRTDLEAMRLNGAQAALKIRGRDPIRVVVQKFE